MKQFSQWWITIAICNLWNFVYTEVGTILRLLKDPTGKFSHKRILALSFGAAALYLILKPRGWLDIVVGGGLVAAAVVLGWISAATKT